jgi:D-alanine-D-alanine ligase
MSKIRVLVLFGGKSGEHAVSLASARSVMQALSPEKYEIIPMGISQTGQWISTPNALGQLTEASQEQLPLQKADHLSQDHHNTLVQVPDFSSVQGIDVVFPVLHGPYGEDGRLQGLLDMMGLPYVGSGVGGSAVGMDKIYTKALFIQAGLKQLPYYAFNFHDWKVDSEQVTSRIEVL